MKVDFNLERFGDYGLLLVALMEALNTQDHDEAAVASERITQLARQKLLEAGATVEGVNIERRTPNAEHRGGQG